MIVLSACETGLGDAVTGQGVLGLRTAVAASGAGVLQIPTQSGQAFQCEARRHSEMVSATIPI